MAFDKDCGCGCGDRGPKSERPQQVCAGANMDAIGATVKATIDGNEVSVPLGMTILEAARKQGVHIPTLCHHDDLCIAGNCRVCVVEVEGMRTLQASCAFPITSPVKVLTHTPKVRRARRHIIDLLLSKHYGECYACNRNENCELQDLAHEHGVDFFRFGHPEEPIFEVDRSSHSVVRDMNKCVLCRRCVRTCIDLQEVGVLEVLGRSDQSEIATFMDKPLGDVICINCGQCITDAPPAPFRPTTPPTKCGPPLTTPRSTSSSKRPRALGPPSANPSASNPASP